MFSVESSPAQCHSRVSDHLLHVDEGIASIRIGDM
jgi:hypothetical protein